MTRRRVAITGLGLVSPFGGDPDDFFARLLAGESAVRFLQTDDRPRQLAMPFVDCRDFDAEAALGRPLASLLDRFARLGVAAGARAFGLVSAVGADPGSANFYLRVKGEAETAVRAAGYDRVEIARPSFLIGERAEVRPGEGLATSVSQALSPLLLGPLAKYRPIAGATVARALVAGLARPENGVFVRHYPELRALAQI